MRRFRAILKKIPIRRDIVHFFSKNGFLRRSPLAVEVFALVVLFGVIAFVGSKNTFFNARSAAYPDFFAENAEFNVLEIPPGEAGIDKSVSSEVFSVIAPSILSQDAQTLIPTILLHYRIKYVTFYDSTSTSLFEPFLISETNASKSPRIDKVDGAKLSQYKEQPFLSLGEGWYKNQQGDEGIYRWIERSAVVRLFIPEGKLDETPTILAFSAKHFPEDGLLDVLLNEQKIETVPFYGDYFGTYVNLKGLKDGDNTITFSASDGFSVPRHGDPRCLSFAFKDIRLVSKEQVSEQGVVRYSGFYPEADSNQSSVSPALWMGTKADIQVFSLNSQRVFVSFEAVSYAKDRTLTVERNGEKLQTAVLHSGSEYQSIGFPFELQEGNNRLDLLSERCDQPSLVEGNRDDRCLGVQIGNFQYEVLR